MRGTSTASIAAVLAAASLPAGCDAMAQWINSTEGIHAFLTFDSSAVPANITAFANDIDYVWGAQQIATWRNSTNPDVVLSKYIPYCRDPTPHLDKNNSGLPWWQENKPELVLYQCDQVTPAWECFPGEGTLVLALSCYRAHACDRDCDCVPARPLHRVMPLSFARCAVPPRCDALLGSLTLCLCCRRCS